MDNIIYPFQLPIYQSFIDEDSFIQIKTDTSLYLKHNFQNFINGWASNTKTSYYFTQNQFKSFILENEIKTHVKNYWKEWGFESTLNLSLCNYWINVAEQGSYQEDHSHDNHPPTSPNLFSGVLYINLPEDSGNLYLYNPIHQHIQTPKNLLMGEKVPIFPKEKLLVLFPSWLRHSVGINQNPNPRISISWNIQLNP